MEKKSRNPLTDPVVIIAKFMAATFFGVIFTITLYFAFPILGLEGFGTGLGFHLLWIIPLGWGVLGIFFFEQMLDIASKFFNSFFRWHNH